MEANGSNANGFWRITISGVAHIILLLGTILTFFITYDRQINETKQTVLQNSRDIGTLTKSISEITSNGSNFSQRAVALQNSEMAALALRESAHDRALADLTPKIVVLQTTLEFLLRQNIPAAPRR